SACDIENTLRICPVVRTSLSVRRAWLSSAMAISGMVDGGATFAVNWLGGGTQTIGSRRSQPTARVTCEFDQDSGALAGLSFAFGKLISGEIPVQRPRSFTQRSYNVGQALRAELGM